MDWKLAKDLSMRPIALIAAVTAFAGFPRPAMAWGRNAHRLIVNKAVDPLDALAKNSSERRNDFIALDKYGRFPFGALPRSYKSAVTKFGKIKLDADGLLPWQIGVYSEKLTEAFKAGKWEEAKLDAALLAHYVAQAHDPFSTTDNFDGHLSGQAGINDRFGSSLTDRYSSFFPMRPNDASDR